MIEIKRNRPIKKITSAPDPVDRRGVIKQMKNKKMAGTRQSRKSIVVAILKSNTSFLALPKIPAFSGREKTERSFLLTKRIHKNRRTGKPRANKPRDKESMGIGIYYLRVKMFMPLTVKYNSCDRYSNVSYTDAYNKSKNKSDWRYDDNPKQDGGIPGFFFYGAPVSIPITTSRKLEHVVNIPYKYNFVTM